MIRICEQDPFKIVLSLPESSTVSQRTYALSIKSIIRLFSSWIRVSLAVPIISGLSQLRVHDAIGIQWMDRGQRYCLISYGIHGNPTTKNDQLQMSMLPGGQSLAQSLQMLTSSSRSFIDISRNGTTQPSWKAFCCVCQRNWRYQS